VSGASGTAVGSDDPGCHVASESRQYERGARDGGGVRWDGRVVMVSTERGKHTRMAQEESTLDIATPTLQQDDTHTSYPPRASFTEISRS
jgi:hypothetical protein